MGENEKEGKKVMVKKKSVVDLKLWLALIIAVIADALDLLLFPIFGIPIIGDIADLITTIILFPLIGVNALIGLGELVPLVDVMPLFTIGVLLKMVGIDINEVFK